MKKILLSFSIIFSFIIYTAFQRLGIFGNQSVNMQYSPTDKTTSQMRAGILEDNNFFAGDEEEDDYVPRKLSTKKTPTLPTQTVTLNTTSVNNLASTSSFAITNTGLYRDGQYIGSVADAYYGNVQVLVIISGGKITDVQFLDYPRDRKNSIRINSYAMPILKSETISVQNANVDGVSGATATSEAFNESLASALAQAKN